jgi:uncharacterized membrane protein
MNQKTSDNYFFIMNWLLLALVFLGFAPSFYLKFLVSEQPFYPNGLPIPYIFHGVILTVWYMFLVFQSGLIRFKKTGIHRRAGWFGSIWALLVLGSTFWVISMFPGRMEQLASEQGLTVEEVEPGIQAILWLDMFMSVLFMTFVLLGIANRNKPEIHKRLMLYSGLVLLFAATGRIGGTISYLLEMEVGPVVGFLILLGLTSSLLVYDYRKRGIILKISLICFGTYWLAIILSLLIGNSDWGREMIIAMLIY